LIGSVPPDQKIKKLLASHVKRLLACDRCRDMHKPVVSGGPIVSDIILVGQAPGDKEPVLGRPFAWTAGKTLFQWFNNATDMSEEEFRAHIYMAAAARCFPGKNPTGGDRVPSREEVHNCSFWRDQEFQILRPRLVIPVGKLGISQFLAAERLDEVVGKQFRVWSGGFNFDLIPLPHPSGASTWHRVEPGKTLLQSALKLIARHPAMLDVMAAIRRERTATARKEAS
jgi:uracil-DNA glycosylase